MKTKEELAALKEEYKALRRALSELTDEELAQITGGIALDDIIIPPGIVTPNKLRCPLCGASFQTPEKKLEHLQHYHGITPPDND